MLLPSSELSTTWTIHQSTRGQIDERIFVSIPASHLESYGSETLCIHRTASVFLTIFPNPSREILRQCVRTPASSSCIMTDSSFANIPPFGVAHSLVWKMEQRREIIQQSINSLTLVPIYANPAMQTNMSVTASTVAPVAWKTFVYRIQRTRNHMHILNLPTDFHQIRPSYHNTNNTGYEFSSYNTLTAMDVTRKQDRSF